MFPESTPWHRLFGLTWANYLSDQPALVRTEVDLSIKQQLLDLVVVCTEHQPITRELPDGFEQLALHNLISFKSFQDTLDWFTLKELVGHGVNYRKMLSKQTERILPEEQFKLFAVCIRSPQILLGHWGVTQLSPGVYDLAYFNDVVRVVVVHELPLKSNNAMFLLLAARDEMVRYGGENYQIHGTDTSTLLLGMLEQYRKEGSLMIETLAEFKQRIEREGLASVEPEKLLAAIPAEKLLAVIPTEKRLEGIPTEKRLEGIPTEKRLEGVTMDELLAALSEADRKSLAQRLLNQNPQTDPPPG